MTPHPDIAERFARLKTIWQARQARQLRLPDPDPDAVYYLDAGALEELFNQPQPQLNHEKNNLNRSQTGGSHVATSP
jgi:hypothetical protein